jgi:hypothetical protein
MTNLIQQHQKEIEKICREEGISYLALFGSHARGDEQPNSDIDLMIDFHPDHRKSLFGLIDVEDKFQNLFGKKIDLVTKNGVNKYFKPYIEADLIPLYGQ